MAQSQRQTGAQSDRPTEAHTPKKGEHFRCSQCGMEIEVTSQCGCKGEDHSHFTCCDKEMAKA